MAFADAAPDHAHAGQHHLHGMRDDVACAAAFETVDADGRHTAARPFVKADRKIEILRCSPERLVIRMMYRLFFIRVRPNKAGPPSPLLAGARPLLDPPEAHFCAPT